MSLALHEAFTAVQTCNHDVPIAIDKDRASTGSGEPISINKVLRLADGLRLTENRLAAQSNIYDVSDLD